MSCVLVIKDNDLKRVLGRTPDQEVAFDTFQDYLNAIPAGLDFLISESDGHFIGSFRQLAYDNGNIRLLYNSEYGRGSVPISEVLGQVTTDLLTQYQDKLNPLAKARLLPPVPTEFDPATPEESIDNAGGSVTSDTAVYDEENSRLKIEQFESTTGQDVDNDFTGTLNSRPSTLSKVALKNEVANNPGKYKYFIVKDSNAYFNEPGVEPEGEVLLVVYKAAYDRLATELGRPLTQAEMEEVAVKMDGSEMVAEGKIYTLPLEGTSPSRAVEGEEDQFFQRKHEERVQIYAEKNGVTEDEAEYHFRQGQENMRDLREQATYAPVEVAVRPSLGFYPNNPMSVAQFEKKYGIEDTQFSINTSKSKVVGRVYLTGSMDGTSVEMLTVPVSLLEKYGADTLAGIANRFFTGSASQEEINFFASIFGVNRRKAGPYMRIENEVAAIMADGHPVTNIEQFNSAMAKNSWPSITNKIRGKESLNQHTILEGSTFKTVSPEEFVREHVTTDGSLWSHRGKPVPYSANRYFYIDPVPGASAPSLQHDSNSAGEAYSINRLFDDVQEFDRLVSSNEPADVERKLTAPRVFSPVFALSQSYKRLRAGLKIIPKLQAGLFSLNIPVGEEYFSNRLEVDMKISDLAKDYTKAQLIAVRDNLRLNAPWLSPSLPTGSILAADMSASTTDEEIEEMFTPAIRVALAQQMQGQIQQRVTGTLQLLNNEGVYDIEATGIDSSMTLEDFVYTNAANATVAEIERQLLYGDTIRIVGTVPDVSTIHTLPAETTFASQFAGEELAPTQTVRSIPLEENVMTLDTYRLYKKLSGTWSNEEESAYQAQLKDPTSKQFEALSIELAYSGPVNVKMSDGVVSSTGETATTGPIRYRVVLPSSDGELHRQLLLAEAGMSSKSGDTFYIGNFVMPGEQTMTAEEEIIASLPLQAGKKPVQTELYDYAVAVLGKNIADKLLVQYKHLTFDDINKYAKFLGDDQFANTRFRTQKDFAISPNTAQAIAEGQKKITLRKRADETVGVVNTGGLVQIDGKVFEMVDMGEMGLKKALEVTGLTQNEFAQQFLGDDTKTIDSIFDPGVKAFFEGAGARRVFMINPVVKPFKTNGVKKGKEVKKRETKTKTLGCRTLR